MAGGISIHVVDVPAGRPAEGMLVVVFALQPERRRIGAGRLTAGGALQRPVAFGEASGPSGMKPSSVWAPSTGRSG